MTVSRRVPLGASDIPDEIADGLRTLDATVVELFIRLARSMWDRTDHNAVAVIKDCTVELPTAQPLPRQPDPGPCGA